jgi:hypothetical protein
MEGNGNRLKIDPECGSGRAIGYTEKDEHLFGEKYPHNGRYELL